MLSVPVWREAAGGRTRCELTGLVFSSSFFLFEINDARFDYDLLTNIG
jgi:hypothetical protein